MILIYCSSDITLYQNKNSLVSNVKQHAEPLMFNLILLHVINNTYMISHLPGSYIPEGLMTSCTWDYITYTLANRSYTMMLCCFVFFIPLGVIFYCYLLMFLAIRKTGRYCNSYLSASTVYVKYLAIIEVDKYDIFIYLLI